MTCATWFAAAFGGREFPSNSRIPFDSKRALSDQVADVRKNKIVCDSQLEQSHLKLDETFLRNLAIAGCIMTGESTTAEVGREIFDLLLRVAAGEMTKSKTLGHREYFIPYKIQDLCVIG